MAVVTTGIPELTDGLKKYKQRALTAVGEALYAWAQTQVGPDAKRRCPVRTGTARASWAVERPTYTASEAAVRFGFGGNASAYVQILHNRTGIRHPVGEDHFLSKAVDEAKGDASSWISTAAASALKGGK
jgi:hypothetical protein